MILFLWKNRVAAPLFSKFWFVIWAKRILLLDKLVFLSLRKLSLRSAKIEKTAIIESIIVDGDPSKLEVLDWSFVGKGSLIASHGVIRIGRNVAINRDVKILSASHDVNERSWNTTVAPIIIDDYCWVGTAAIILPGTHLQRGVVVGAGAVVSGSIPENAVVVGNPSKIIKYRDRVEFDYRPAKFSALFNAWLGG